MTALSEMDSAPAREYKFTKATMKLRDKFRARWYDFVHNVDTHSRVDITNLEVVGKNKSHAFMYAPTLPSSMYALFAHFEPVDSSTTFIDIGCGKGLTLLVAARYPFRRVIGVEFSPALHRIAEQNIQTYRGGARLSSSRPEVLCMDAADFQFPEGPLLVYFFNPFHPPVMERVLSNIGASLRANPREITLIFDKLHNRDLILRYLDPRKIESVVGFGIYSDLQPQPS